MKELTIKPRLEAECGQRKSYSIMAALDVKWGIVTGDFTEEVALKLNPEGYIGFIQ